MAESSFVVSVNAGRSRPVPWGQLRRSAIDKRPVDGRVEVDRLGLAIDEQADQRHHGGLDQAVYAFAIEDLDWWAANLGRELPSGSFGENLTTRGVDITNAVIGERWRIGDVLLEVSSPRIPCSVFAGFIGEPNWMKRFTEGGRPGSYLRVLEEGTLGAGDSLSVEKRPNHGVTVGEVFRAKSGERHLVPRLLEAAELPENWHSWARQVLAQPSAV